MTTTPRTLAAPLERLKNGHPLAQIGLVVGLSVVAALGQVHLRLVVLEAGYELSRETRTRRDLEDQNQKLRLELEMRRNPSMIERRAREELQMAPPDPASIRILRADVPPMPSETPAASPAAVAAPVVSPPTAPTAAPPIAPAAALGAAPARPGAPR